MVVLIDPELVGLDIDGGPDRSGFRLVSLRRRRLFGGCGGALAPPQMQGGVGGRSPPTRPARAEFFTFFYIDKLPIWVDI